MSFEEMNARLFPSPCGDVVLKSLLSGACNPWDDEFPSPCGDVVLKFIMAYHIYHMADVSVPLRGYGFEMNS